MLVRGKKNSPKKGPLEKKSADEKSPEEKSSGKNLHGKKIPGKIDRFFYFYRLIPPDDSTHTHTPNDAQRSPHDPKYTKLWETSVREVFFGGLFLGDILSRGSFFQGLLREFKSATTSTQIRSKICSCTRRADNLWPSFFRHTKNTSHTKKYELTHFARYSLV